MLTTVLLIDLSSQVRSDSGDFTYGDDADDRHRLDGLGRLPDGSRVVISVGSRKFVSSSAKAFIGPHVDRLVVQVEGTDSAAVAQWHAALSGVVM